MTDKPILFSGSMVRAILDGRKTQARRVIKVNGMLPDYGGPTGCKDDPTCWGWEDAEHGDWVTLEKDGQQRMGWRDLAVAFRTGDRLWVRETWTEAVPLMGNKQPIYKADEGTPRCGPMWSMDKWKPSIHMPRWASRITLIVTDVRVQRLQDISEEDAASEGVEALDFERIEPDYDWSVCPHCGGTRLVNRLGRDYGVIFDCDCTYCDTHKKRFRYLWNSINAKRGYDWDVNPWVVAITFKPVFKNIDKME